MVGHRGFGNVLDSLVVALRSSWTFRNTNLSISGTLSPEEKQKVRSKVEEVVSGLHAEGFVHGNIRDANLLIDRESLAKEVKVHFIGFDWAGPVETTTYLVGSTG